MTTEHALCIDLRHRNIRVFIPTNLVPVRCHEVVATCCQQPVMCADDMYHLLDALPHLPDPQSLSPQAISLGIAIVLSNFDYLLDDEQRTALSAFYKANGCPLIYDRSNGLWTPPELLTYPPVLHAQHNVSMAIH